MNRREALVSLGVMAALAKAGTAAAEEMRGFPPETALDAAFKPSPVRQGGGMRVLVNETDRRNVAAVFDRLIPGDDLGASASDAGCVEFLDGQLDGPYGQGKVLYREGPKGDQEDALMQTPQFIATPRERYESGLTALEAYCQRTDGASFADLQPNRQDEILEGMESGAITLAADVNTKAFFELMLQNVREGYFADPIYGGNRDMVGWKLIGFPGARYDYRLYADRTGEKLDLQPVSLIPKD